jgi:hypothetical protein
MAKAPSDYDRETARYREEGLKRQREQHAKQKLARNLEARTGLHIAVPDPFDFDAAHD